MAQRPTACTPARDEGPATCNCSDNQLRSLEKKTKFKLHVSNYQIIHLPQHNWVPINTLTTPLNSWKLQSESVVSRKKGLKRKVIPAENPSKNIFGKLRGWRRDR
eukprot:TRINITY_DN24888_c0_g1_i2.p1 TRINITY_DN24888_c0_g1~~TRINITY_DN24888_c0_g1_i2.p1  ORF type:complete len:105 (-),score=20.76 TRINITY_DN24888_c0_g1_i2:108-422(-)